MSLQAQHGIVCRTPDSLFGYWGWPSLCRMPDGTLVAACSGFRLRHVCPFGKNVLFFSKDGGETWSPPIVANDTPKDDRDAGIVSLGGDSLLLSWFSHPKAFYLPGGPFWDSMQGDMLECESLVLRGAAPYLQTVNENRYPAGSFTRVSHDRGLTWSAMHRCPVSAPHGPALLRDGSLLYLGKEMYDPFVALEEKNTIAAYHSADEGETWQKLGVVPLPARAKWNDFHEPHVLQLPGGRLLGMLRYQCSGEKPYGFGFSMFQTVSDDGGATWSVPFCVGVSGSPPHLLRHSSGAVICSYGRREAPCGERVMISYDEGESWVRDLSLGDDSAEGDLGYPASCELEDGSLVTVYYQHYQKDRQASILYTKWKLPERS